MFDGSVQMQIQGSCELYKMLGRTEIRFESWLLGTADSWSKVISGSGISHCVLPRNSVNQKAGNFRHVNNISYFLCWPFFNSKICKQFTPEIRSNILTSILLLYLEK